MTYVYDDVWTIMCVWEDLLDRWRHFSNDRRAPDVEETLMITYWSNVGTSQVRDDVICRIAPWVDKIWRNLVEKVGPDGHVAIGLDAYDWEFIPACTNMIEWNTTADGFDMPDPERVAALLIAGHALGKEIPL